MAEKRVFKLDGVACGGCVSIIEEAIAESGLQINVSFNLAEKTATVVSDANTDQIIKLIQDAGYGAQLQD